jgi:hypothetical protein
VVVDIDEAAKRGAFMRIGGLQRLPLTAVTGNGFVSHLLYERTTGLVRTRIACAFGALVLGALIAPGPRAQDRGAVALGAGRSVAQGVTLYRPDVSGMPELPQPLAVQALALDPRVVDVTSALALGRQQGRAAVADAARRESAIAAVNAGFFVLATGDPTGVLRVDGDLVSDTRLMRGAVAITSDARGLRVTFDRVRVRVALEVRAGGRWREAPLDAVDSVRRLGGATLYTPRFGRDTGTPLTGVEWTLAIDGAPRLSRFPRGAVVTRSARVDALGRGASPIPANGAVVSFGGERPPAPFHALSLKARPRIRQTWETETPRHADAFAGADDVVGGAGLLLKDGRAIEDWSIEQTSDSLRTVRHPRTLIGVDARGTIWLVTVDGRQPGYSVGVTFPELLRLSQSLGLTSALNLDGGGSTTMVVKGEIVNRPSDPIGPRPVSDVLLVRPRPAPRPAAPR